MAPLGFLLVDKPKDITSFYVVKFLRRILKVKRMGYAGTLDPLATGLMIVAVGEATKLLNALEQKDKVYDVTIRFGSVSETGDAEGPIREYSNAKVPDRDQIEKVIQDHFTGECLQVPPRFSAVKIQGKRAYHMARKGQKVELQPRKVTFYSVEILKYSYPLLEVRVHCSVGTYIRSLAYDLGEKLQCGGYVESLRRTKIGDFIVADAISLVDVDEVMVRKSLIPPEKFLTDWRQRFVDDREYQDLCHGAFIEAGEEFATQGGADGSPILALYKNECVGMLEFTDDGRLKFYRKFNLA